MCITIHQCDNLKILRTHTTPIQCASLSKQQSLSSQALIDLKWCTVAIVAASLCAEPLNSPRRQPILSPKLKELVSIQISHAQYEFEGFVTQFNCVYKAQSSSLSTDLEIDVLYCYMHQRGLYESDRID